MITPEELLEAGYKKHEANKGEFCLGLYQKAVIIAGKKLYYLNLWQWQFPQQDLTWSADARFYRLSGWEFDVKLSVTNEDIVEEVEDFFYSVYSRMCCVPDKLNQ